MAEDIEKLKFKINYTFQNRGLLKEALTHRSYAVENGLQYDNQRLEFLGDAVLEIILTEHLFRLYPSSDEGDMTKMRSALVREESLAMLARKIDLGVFLQMGKGELENGGPERNSTLADLFEALLGAWYLDDGLDRLRAFVIGLIQEAFPTPEKLLSTMNPKGILQEYSQRRWGVAPVYNVLCMSGPEHNPVYEVEVQIQSDSAVGRAQSRKTAETQAAAELLKKLNDVSIL